MYELTIYFLHWHEGQGERFYRVASFKLRWDLKALEMKRKREQEIERYVNILKRTF